MSYHQLSFTSHPPTDQSQVSTFIDSLDVHCMLDNLIKLMMMTWMMSALLSYLILLPQRQLWLLLLKFLRTLHHKIDDVDAAGQREQHQDVG